MTSTDEIETLLARVIEHHLQHGTLPSMASVAGGRADVAARLEALVREYLDVNASLDAETARAGDDDTRLVGDRAGRPSLPVGWLSIEGFRTIERLGQGGMGEVYKLEDLTLGRTVAAKVIRRDGGARLHAKLADFLREARSLALFSDPHVVQVFEFREDAEPPVLLMEFVEGFELGRVGRSLEVRQRARIMRELSLALARAHELGIQHRDLKPSNIMLDSQLTPKILDFGLSGSDPARGHLVGTLSYIAPEQLDPGQPIDARTDVYALGVILYELLTGIVPFGGASDADVVAAIHEGQPRLPVEIEPDVPEALQAIALKAMERRPADRYQSARELALDLDRYLEGRAVHAKPTLYATTLGAKVRPHLDQIGEWQRLNLIYPHEAERLRAAYRQLDAREDEWIVASRSLSYSQIALYLGAFFLFAGSLFYFWMHRIEGAAAGLLRPVLVLGLPFVGLNLAGRWLYRREQQAVAVAFYLGGVSLLPLFLLIWFHETSLWVGPGDSSQLFGDAVSNRQLQVTVFIAVAWSSWLALRTRTGTLSVVSTVLLFLFAVAVLADFGLRDVIAAGEYHRLALRLSPLVGVFGGAALVLERSGRAWFAEPLYIAAGLVLVAVLDFASLDGKLFHHLGISLQRLQPDDVSSPVLIDTLAALTVNGVLFYAIAAAIERHGTALMSPAAQVLFTIAPFSMLEPLAVLSETAEYQKGFDWIYLLGAIAIAVLSHARQRRSFYYAGVINSGVALFLIAARNEWFNRASWATTLVIVGLVTLTVGYLIDRTQRRRA
ncbi:MAG TPA: serine/threonine-protein kinase [Vicinamibacterales bacterium]|nr:serine/threonine-protein kinase [Vicinamibacterales bacterium]